MVKKESLRERIWKIYLDQVKLIASVCRRCEHYFLWGEGVRVCIEKESPHYKKRNIEMTFEEEIRGCNKFELQDPEFINKISKEDAVYIPGDSSLRKHPCEYFIEGGENVTWKDFPPIYSTIEELIKDYERVCNAVKNTSKRLKEGLWKKYVKELDKDMINHMKCGRLLPVELIIEEYLRLK